MDRTPLFLSIVALVTACNREPVGVLAVEVIASPDGSSSRLPDFAADGNGGALLTWVEDVDDTTTLFGARCDADGIGSPRRIESGDDWFVNWADFPAAALHGDSVIASFLQRTGEETYDYAVRFTRSLRGEEFTPPVTLHDDDGPGEHGFVTWTTTDEGFAAVWLDGRETGGGEGHGHVGGSMQLRFRTVSLDGARSEELLIDDRVCDCCQTDIVSVDDGFVIAYRDRSEDERRDITVVRVGPDRAVDRTFDTDDGWVVAGCPVNGPSLAADGPRVALAWTTNGSDDVPRVFAALSTDGGRTFGTPARLGFTGVIGRVDVAFDAHERPVVTWLEQDRADGLWRVARLDRAGRVLDDGDVATASPGRDAGFGRLARVGDDLLFAFTEASEPPRVGLRRLQWR